MSEPVPVPTKVRETFISCVEAPRLEEISANHFVKFEELRQLYEKQVEEIRMQTGAKIMNTSYKVSIEGADLNIFITTVWIDTARVSKTAKDPDEKGVA